MKCDSIGLESAPWNSFESAAKNFAYFFLIPLPLRSSTEAALPQLLAKLLDLCLETLVGAARRLQEGLVVHELESSRDFGFRSLEKRKVSFLGVLAGDIHGRD
jgi:hypothetical protein